MEIPRRTGHAGKLSRALPSLPLLALVPSLILLTFVNELCGGRQRIIIYQYGIGCICYRQGSACYCHLSRSQKVVGLEDASAGWRRLEQQGENAHYQRSLVSPRPFPRVIMVTFGGYTTNILYVWQQELRTCQTWLIGNKRPGALST